jgi:hypothetical protein
VIQIFIFVFRFSGFCWSMICCWQLNNKSFVCFIFITTIISFKTHIYTSLASFLLLSLLIWGHSNRLKISIEYIIFIWIYTYTYKQSL